MLETLIPYEFLVRWDETGTLRGAHIVTRSVVTADDGTILSDRQNSAQPVSLAGELGFPLGDLLPTITQDALIAKEAAEVECARLREALAAITTERDALQAELVTVTTERDALQAI